MTDPEIIPGGQSHRLPGLDVLRAVAIASVLIAHLWPAEGAAQVPNALGILGVELFFALSGFLIGGILIRQVEQGELLSPGGLVGFLKRRWYRTLPNYYLFLMAHIIWRQCVMGFPDVLITQLDHFAFFQNATNLFFPETWSLVVEEWFYLIFSLALFAALRCFKRPRNAILVVTAALWILPVLARAAATLRLAATDGVDLERVWDGFLRKTAYLRFDALMYGVMAAAVARWDRGLWQRLAGLRWIPSLLLVITLGSLVFGVPLSRSRPIQGLLLWPLMGVGLTALLPWASRPDLRFNPTLAGSARFLAGISYSLYLTHGLVMKIVHWAAGPKSALFLPQHTPAWSVVVLLLSILLATIVHHVFETPIMNLRDRKAGAERPAQTAP